MCTFTPDLLWEQDGIVNNSPPFSHESNGADGRNRHRKDLSSREITTTIDPRSTGYYKWFFERLLRVLSSDNPETVNQTLIIIRSGASEQEILAALSADDSSAESTIETRLP